jgi:hypothetical protein
MLGLLAVRGGDAVAQVTVECELLAPCHRADKIKASEDASTPPSNGPSIMVGRCQMRQNYLTEDNDRAQIGRAILRSCRQED